MESLLNAIEGHFEQGKNASVNYIDSHLEIKRTLSISELFLRATSIAGYLKNIGCKKGDRIVISCVDTLELIPAFLGCLYAGVIAVPCYPPYSYQTLEKLIHITDDIQPKMLLIDNMTKKLFSLLGLKNWLFINKIIGHVIDKKINQTILNKINFLQISQQIIQDIPLLSEQYHPALLPRKDTVAFIQYTSGSTILPRGVIITHENIVNNIKAISSMMQLDANARVLSWLPVYHDMGLIGCALSSIYLGCDFYTMQPIDFLKHPISWLQAISRYQITHSGGPNFAYDLCIHKSDDVKECLDLSSWRVAFNGAEPVKMDTLQKFNEKFSHYNFNLRAFNPCYGLAENTLFATVNDQTDMLYLTISKNKLKENIVEPTKDPIDSYPIVNCGKGFSNEKICIIDPTNNHILDEDKIGEICLSSPSLSSGYWNNQELTKKYFNSKINGYSEKFLRTGDLGFLHKGNLFITGRNKDLIIKYGKNYYPQDIERIVEISHHSIRKGCVIAIACQHSDQEQVIVFAEIKSEFIGHDYALIVEAIKQNIEAFYQLSLDKIILLPPKTITKTTSGKPQRQKMKEQYLTDNIKGLNI